MHLWIWRGRNVDAPKSGARWFTRSYKDVVTKAVMDLYLMSVHKCCAASIAQFAKTDEVVSEAWDDMAGVCFHGG